MSSIISRVEELEAEKITHKQRALRNGPTGDPSLRISFTSVLLNMVELDICIIGQPRDGRLDQPGENCGEPPFPPERSDRKSGKGAKPRARADASAPAADANATLLGEKRWLEKWRGGCWPRLPLGRRPMGVTNNWDPGVPEETTFFGCFS